MNSNESTLYNLNFNMKRRKFIENISLFGGLTMIDPSHMVTSKISRSEIFPEVRTALDQRKFKSNAIESAILDFQNNVKNKELGWLFNNCFPNTLDTTVFYNDKYGANADTYVITGDIDAMWLRDSAAQVWPYLEFVGKDEKLQGLITGVINRQIKYILKDPYANAFYYDPQKVGEWASDETDMQPGVHERKWEIDSLCYPIRLAYAYWKTTGDTTPFNENWEKSIRLIYQTFREQQKKESRGPYSFQRETTAATDTRALNGYGYPVNPTGLICSAFRPSDDATVFSFLIPSNFFAVTSLRQAAEMLTKIAGNTKDAERLQTLANEVEKAINDYAIITHPQYGEIYAYEIDGFGNKLMMDDANVPSLLSLPYLNNLPTGDKVYRNTRRFVWSLENPFYFEGDFAEGVGGPHVAMDMIWPMSLIIKGLTSGKDAEILNCISVLMKTHGETGFMHESFNKNDPKKFTRAWFAWANTLFGELLWKTFKEKRYLLDQL